MAEKLKQTKSYSVFKGKIYGLHNEKKPAITSNDFAQKMQFLIKTAGDNTHYCQLTQFLSQVGNDVYFSTKTDDGKTETKKVPWDKRNEKFEGWNLIGVGIKGNGEENVTNFIPADAMETIIDKFVDGDTVVVKTEKLNSAKGNNTYANYEVKGIYISKDEIDFEAEDFQEISDFTEQFVFVSTGGTSKKMEVSGYSINYKGNLTMITMVVDMEDEDMKTVGEYIKKNVKFGDVVKAEGIIHNRANVTWIETDAEVALVGKKRKSSGGGGKKEKVVDGERKEFEITAISEITKGVYAQSDFEVEDSTVEKMPWEV